MKRILVKSMGALLLVFLCMTGAVKTKAATWNESVSQKVTKGAFTFHVYFSANGKESWIHKVEMDPKKGSLKTLKFPTKVKGAKVTKLGHAEAMGENEFYKTIFDEWVEEAHEVDGYVQGLEKIKKLVIPATVKEITNCTFSGMKALKNVKLPNGLTKIKRSVFYGCKDLKKVTLPKKLKKFDNGAFAGCGSLEKVSISKKNKHYRMQNSMLLSKNKKTLYWVAPYKSKVKIPVTVKRIYKGAFEYSDAVEIRIPKSVTRIDKDALYGNWVQKVILDKKNGAFFKKNNRIYNKKTKAVVWKYTEPLE